MKQYRGLYIDHVYFNSTDDIDRWLKEKAIRNYRMRVEIFLREDSMEASIFVDEQAEILNREFGMDWSEIEAIEIETMEKGA